ncbi:MAG: amidohydrolase family protein [Acidobacteriota bacterium]
MTRLSPSYGRRRSPFWRAALTAALAAGTAAVSADGVAADAVTADRTPSVHALVGARIVVAPGQVLESGTLVIRDGLIEAVGADLEPPADARVWELDELTLYPGLIESFHLRDWPEVDEDGAPQGGHPNALVNPERDMLLHAQSDSAFKKLREAGFTTAVFAPKPGLFRGQSVLTNLGAGDIHANVLATRLAQHLHLTSTNGFEEGYPTSSMGAVALVRQTLMDAAHHAEARALFAKQPRQKRPTYSTALAALEAAVDGGQPVVIESHDLAQSLLWTRLVAEFKLDATLVGGGVEYRRLDELVKAGLPWILPLRFPKAPEVKDEDDLSVDLKTLRHWYWAPHNLHLAAEAGLDFVLTSHRLSDPKKIHEMAARAIERGFSADDVLAAFTTKPARRLGLGDRAGSLEKGKMANIVVADGDLFTAETSIRSIWVDGRRYEIKKIEPPTVDPLGTWDVTINAGGEVMRVQMTLTGTVEDLDGSIGTPMGSLPLQDAYVSGDTVEVAIDSTPLGMPGTVTFSMSIEGDSASGPGTAPQGPFTFTAERIAGPEEPEASSAVQEVAR